MNDYRTRLVDSIRRSQAVIVLGAGTSISMTRNEAAASWLGLLENGIARVGESLGQDANWTLLNQMMLESARETSDTFGMIGVAGQIVSKLGGNKSQAYADWLRDSIGSLVPRDRELASAIRALEVPIFTTNYDTLMETALNTGSADWTDVESMRDVFSGVSQNIGHIHGMWKKPETVVLTESDYAHHIANENIQFVQQAQYSAKSFIYIGFGGGLEDPNFGKLLEVHSKMFPNSRGDHFRLCRTSELKQLEGQHWADDVRAVVYGDAHADLLPFLTQISKESHTTSERQDRLTFAREALVDTVRESTVIASHLEDPSTKELAELTIPPVLLPVPHEHFASMQKYDDDLKPKRIDPHSTYPEAKLLVVAGEELSGLTTALNWLIAQAAFERPGAAPIIVDGRQCRLTKNPLMQQVKHKAIQTRIIDHKKHDLPPHVLGIDNLMPDDTHEYAGIISDIKNISSEFIVIGTKLGEEHRVFSDLDGMNLPREIVYLGKLGRNEVAQLASFVAPARQDDIADAVMESLQRENLTRNPFTISLLVCLFAQKWKVTKHSSETNVLDDYVSMLLGRNGAALLDARFSLSPQNRQVILSELAKAFVRKRKGALSQSEAITCFEEYIASVGWKEDASRILDSFQAIRVLRNSDGMVQFQQSSYLHLFAARAAIDDQEFLEEILSDALFFAPIVRHYAALLRNNVEIVEHVESMLDGSEDAPPAGRIFGRLTPTSAPDNLGKLFDSSEVDEDPEPAPVPEEPKTDSSPDYEEYDYSPDVDRVPFPLEDTGKMSPTVRRVRLTDLASRVLRDSDQLPNLDLKLRVLKKILREWGAAVDALEHERVFEEPARKLAEALVEDGKLRSEDLAEYSDKFSMFMTAFVIFANISESLSSRKLLVLQEKLATDQEFRRDDYGSSIAAMFAFDVQETGWTAILPALIEEHGNRWIVSEFLAMLATITFRWSHLSVEDENNLKNFLRERASLRYTFESESVRKMRLARYEQDIVRDRKLHARSMLPAGSSVIEALGK